MKAGTSPHPPSPWAWDRVPLFWIGAPMLLGISLAPWAPLGPIPPVLGACACVALGLGRPETARWGITAGALLLGLALPLSIPEGPDLLGRSRVLGVVASGSTGRSTTLALEALASDPGPWVPTRGRLRAVFPERAPSPGSRVVARGKARTGPDTTLPGEPGQGSQALTRAPTLLFIEDWAPEGGLPVEQPAPAPFATSPHRGVLLALALGDMTAIDDTTNALYRGTGTSHLLSIGGLHVSLVAAPAALLATWLARLAALVWPRSRSRWWGALAGTLAALAYGQAAGWPVSAVRAVVGGSLALVLVAMERRRDPWNLLGDAFIVLAVMDPAVVVSPSWQLSFGALAGLLLVTPRLQRLLPPDLPRPARWVAEGLATTLAATAGTLPASAWWFQRLPPLSPLANLLAVPVVGAITTPAALLGAFAPEPLARLATWVADRSLDLVEGWLRLFPGVSWYPAVGPAGALLLLAAVFLVRRPAVAGLLALLALGLREMPRGELTLTFLSVGDGDSVLVEWPDGRRWLVDGGPRPEPVARYLRRRGIRHLEQVVLTHPHPDHLGGLAAVVSSIPVENLWVPRLPQSQETAFLELVELARTRQVPVRTVGVPGLPSIWPPGPGLETENDESIVLHLVHGSRGFLLTGDIGARVEEGLTWDGPTDVLKVAHHGSRTSTSEVFLQRLAPALAVISTGGGNGHPHPAVLARLGGVPVLRTDRDGTVSVATDGTALRVRCWRPDGGWRLVRRAPVGRYRASAEALGSSAGGSARRSPSSSTAVSLSFESSRNM